MRRRDSQIDICVPFASLRNSSRFGTNQLNYSHHVKEQQADTESAFPALPCGGGIRKSTFAFLSLRSGTQVDLELTN